MTNVWAESPSEWQLNEVRKAMRNYLEEGSRYHGRNLSLKSFVDAVAEYARIDLPYEVVRKFYRGVRQANACYALQSPRDPLHLLAIANYLADDENGAWLCGDRLRAQKPSNTSARMLQKFLVSGNCEVSLLHPEQACGKYESVEFTDKQVIRKILAISDVTHEGIGECILINEIHDSLPNKSKIRKGAKPRRVVRQNGWCVITPEDTILLFTKNTVSQMNLYGFTSAINSDAFVENGGLNQFIVWLQDYPIEYNSLDGRDTILQHQLSQVHEFERAHQNFDLGYIK